MDWFRYHTKSLDNPKVQDLPPNLFKAWVNILCVARIFGGVLPDSSEVAFRLRANRKQTESWIKELVERRLMDVTPDGVTPHNWDIHQCKSDDATARKRGQRERQSRSRSRDTSRDTSQDCPVVDQNRTEIEQRQTRAEQAVCVSAPPLEDDVTRRELLDEQFAIFKRLYFECGANVIDEDFEGSNGGCAVVAWAKLDCGEKQARINALKARIDAGEDPRYFPKPLRFVQTEWKRPPRPAPSADPKGDAIKALAMRNLARTGRLL